MPIKLNLLAEQIEERERRRRDPVKRAGIVAGVVVGIFILWVGSIQWTIMSRGGEISDLEAGWKKIESDHKKALILDNDIEKENNKNLALLRFARERFLWATTLDELQFCLVDNVKVTQVTGTQKFTVEKQKDNKLDKKTGLLEKAGSPGKSTENTVFTIQAYDFGNGGDEWNYFSFKSTVESRFKDRFFSLAEVDENGVPGKVTMQELSSPLIDPITSVRYRNLEIDCEFPHVTREDEIFSEELIRLQREKYQAEKAAKEEGAQ